MKSQTQKIFGEEIINTIVGELLIKDKYRFLPNGLVGEIVRDTFEELNKKSKETTPQRITT